jgi:hypothetical protein
MIKQYKILFMKITKQILKDLLKHKIIQITFKKKDGTERVMKCTLQEDLVPIYEKKTERVKKQNDETLAVWDLEKDSFRSFKLDSLIDYQIIEEGYEL